MPSKNCPQTFAPAFFCSWLATVIFARNSKARSLASHPVRAHFAGFKNQRDLSPYFHASDVLVLPSRHGETWGLVVNEALHHGVPAICSDAVGCVPDLVETGKTGLTFGTDRVEELARALEQVLAWQDNDAVRQACRSKVADYSVTRAAEGIARAYREIAR